MFALIFFIPLILHHNPKTSFNDDQTQKYSTVLLDVCLYFKSLS